MDANPNYQFLSLLALWWKNNPGQAMWLCGGALVGIAGICGLWARVGWPVAKSHAQGEINILNERLNYASSRVQGEISTLNERLKLKDDQKAITDALLKVANDRIAQLVTALPRDIPREQLAITARIARNAVTFAAKANNEPEFAKSLGKGASELELSIDAFVDQLVKERGPISEWKEWPDIISGAINERPVLLRDYLDKSTDKSKKDD
jgi:hypothetical protein